MMAAMNETPASLRDVLRESLRCWTHGGARLLSGAVAFYALLSVVPVLMIAIRIAGIATDEDSARVTLLQNLARWIGRGGASTVAALLTSATRAARGHWSVDALVLVYASSRLFAVIQRALHLLWEVPMHTPELFRHKVLTQLRRRALAVAIVGIVAVLLIAMVFWNGVVAYAHQLLGAHPSAWRAASGGFSFLLTVLLFTSIFKVLPEARVSARDAALGGLVTAVLFSAGAALVGIYIGHKATQSFFGAASSLVMLLLWVNYSAQVFFLGASFTGAHARLRGNGIHPRA
jgi:membrane protein